VILSSGLGGSANYWKPNLAALAEDLSRDRLRPSRGPGGSDRALPDTVTVEDFADDILALMDALGIEKVHIVGHAAGGVAGWRWR
jgi:aminoacrylate hydrolase